MTRPPVSACIITYSEGENIRRCLESVKWVDEIVVVDSYSGDATVNICREYTDRIHQREFTGHIEQKNYALQCANYDWVLCIDADEELSPQLALELQTELEENSDQHQGFLFPRRAFYLGRWIEHSGWYPDYKLRVFRKSLGGWGGINPHDKVELNGKTKRLNNDLYHFTYEDMSHHIRTINSFSSIYVKEALKRGERFNLSKLILRPPLKFLEIYLYKKGFMDGLPGFVIAIVSSYYIFQRYAKMWEAQRTGNSPA